MVTPRYHKNSAGRAVKASTSREQTVLRAEKRFRPELSTNKFVDSLVAEGFITREVAKAIKFVRSAEQFQEYCLGFKIPIGSGLARLVRSESPAQGQIEETSRKNPS